MRHCILEISTFNELLAFGAQPYHITSRVCLVVRSSAESWCREFCFLHFSSSLCFICKLSLSYPHSPLFLLSTSPQNLSNLEPATGTTADLVRAVMGTQCPAAGQSKTITHQGTTNLASMCLPPFEYLVFVMSVPFCV